MIVVFQSDSYGQNEISIQKYEMLLNKNKKFNEVQQIAGVNTRIKIVSVPST
jgi:hypothetical protein